MPKKRQPQSLLTKPSSTAPVTFSSARTGTSHHGERPSNVNDLLQQLRVSQRRHENALPQPTSMASVHPAVRNILDLPDTAPPRPRPDTRPQYHGPSRVRRIPGPPPPKSWLSKHGPKHTIQLEDVKRLQHQRITLPEALLVDEKSLQHMLLKSLALNWNFHAEYDQLYMTRIPVRLRETLLSYISLFRAGDDQLWDPLRILFPESRILPDDLEKDDPRDVRRLDLGNALGKWLSFKTLRKSILVQGPAPDLVILKATEQKSPEQQEGVVEDVPESWEDVGEEPVSPLRQPISTGILSRSTSLRFQNLRHLSLALNPGTHYSAASWSSLLSIASHLNTLESLSLAHWPLPTYTPEAAATYATVSSSVAGLGHRFVYGGTNIYSALENDWRESSGILKSLSRSLYCLKWLDLTGCVSWLPSLVWEDPIAPGPANDEFGTAVSNFRGDQGYESASMWNGYWRGVVWLGLSVGWTPSLDSDEPDGSAFTRLSTEHAVLQLKADQVAMQIRQKRIAGKGHRIEFG